MKQLHVQLQQNSFYLNCSSKSRCCECSPHLSIRASWSSLADWLKEENKSHQLTAPDPKTKKGTELKHCDFSQAATRVTRLGPQHWLCLLLWQSNNVTIATPASLPCDSDIRTREKNVNSLFNFMLLLISCSVRALKLLSEDFGLELFGGEYLDSCCALYHHTICVLLSQTQKVSDGRIRVTVAIAVSSFNTLALKSFSERGRCLWVSTHMVVMRQCSFNVSQEPAVSKATDEKVQIRLWGQTFVQRRYEGQTRVEGEKISHLKQAARWHHQPSLLWKLLALPVPGASLSAECFPNCRVNLGLNQACNTDEYTNWWDKS